MKISKKIAALIYKVLIEMIFIISFGIIFLTVFEAIKPGFFSSKINLIFPLFFYFALFIIINQLSDIHGFEFEKQKKSAFNAAFVVTAFLTIGISLLQLSLLSNLLISAFLATIIYQLYFLFFLKH